MRSCCCRRRLHYFMVTDDTRKCDDCGHSLRPEQAYHRDGSVTTAFICDNPQCSGPGGPHVTSSVEWYADDGVRHRTRGKPSQNEANVPEVARAFVRFANEQFRTDYVEPASLEHDCGAKVDCVLSGPSSGTLMLQVTRVLPKAKYGDQAEAGHRNLRTSIHEAASWICDAVRRKRPNADPAIVLVLDGLDGACAAFAADVDAARQLQLDESGGNWHSVWIVGAFGLRHLFGRREPKP